MRLKVKISPTLICRLYCLPNTDKEGSNVVCLIFGVNFKNLDHCMAIFLSGGHRSNYLSDIDKFVSFFMIFVL